MLNRLGSESVKLAQDIKSQFDKASPRDIDRLKIEYFTELNRLRLIVLERHFRCPMKTTTRKRS